jgi:hypothetical protein
VKPFGSSMQKICLDVPSFPSADLLAYFLRSVGFGILGFYRFVVWFGIFSLQNAIQFWALCLIVSDEAFLPEQFDREGFDFSLSFISPHLWRKCH